VKPGYDEGVLSPRPTVDQQREDEPGGYQHAAGAEDRKRLGPGRELLGSDWPERGGISSAVSQILDTSPPIEPTIEELLRRPRLGRAAEATPMSNLLRAIDREI